MITEEVFDILGADQEFATGYTIDSPEGANMSHSGRVLRWVAVKGYANDFAVYIGLASQPDAYIRSNGDKVSNIHNLKKLLSCSEEVWKKYRH